jgi:FHS family L-fucose permease-like MFS transporter
MFTVGRFAGTALLSIVAAPVLLCIYATICTLMAILIGSLHGMAGVGGLMGIMFFESIMCEWPTILLYNTTLMGIQTLLSLSSVQAVQDDIHDELPLF